MRKLLIATFFIVLCLGFYALVKAEDPTDPSKINTSTPPKEQVYKFLAPLGDGFSCMSESGKNEAGEEGKCVKGGIGSYLNTIFMLLIGIAGVLSVVMIIVHSIQYMGDESVFGKTEAKAGIKSAIFGLLIALGAYALLNTINPALTGKDGVSVDGVEIEFEDTSTDNNYTDAQATQIIENAVKTKNVKIGRGGGGVVIVGGIQNHIINVAEKPGLKKIDGIVIHWTAGITAKSAEGTWIEKNTDNTKQNDIAAHFIVDKDGSIWQTVGINMRANHFVASNDLQTKNGVKKPLNNYNTLGVEIVSRGMDKKGNLLDLPNQKQIDSTKRLVKYLIGEFGLSKNDIWGHGQIGKNRPLEENMPMINAIKTGL